MHSFDDETFDTNNQSTPQAAQDYYAHGRRSDISRMLSRQSISEEQDDEDELDLSVDLNSIVSDSLTIGSPYLLPPFQVQRTTRASHNVIVAAFEQQNVVVSAESNTDGPFETIGWLLLPGPGHTPPPWPTGISAKKPTAWDRVSRRVFASV